MEDRLHSHLDFPYLHACHCAALYTPVQTLHKSAFRPIPGHDQVCWEGIPLPTVIFDNLLETVHLHAVLQQGTNLFHCFILEIHTM